MKVGDPTPASFDPTRQFFARSVVRNDEVRLCQPLFTGCLTSHACPRITLIEPTLTNKSSHRCLRIGIDHDEACQVTPGRHPSAFMLHLTQRLDQEWHIENHHMIQPLLRIDSILHCNPDSGVHDGVEVLQCGIVIEYDFSNGPSVQSTIRPNDTRPEPIDDGLVHGLPLFLQFTCNHVSVYDNCPQLSQNSRDCGLSGPDSTCQPNQQHPANDTRTPLLGRDPQQGTGTVDSEQVSGE